MRKRKSETPLSALSSIPSPCREPGALRYQVIAAVGEGAQSVVYSAKSLRTGEAVAIKEIKNHRPSAFPVADYFREISILKSLPPNPAIIALVDIVSSETQLLLVFELCELNLREWIDSHGPLRGSALAGAARQLFCAVEHIHNHGVMHRDIKPHNFLIKDGRMKLADFGLAKRMPTLLWQETPLTMQVASLWYRAPEIMLGAERYDMSIDVWAAGCVLFEMVTGNVLFQGESEISTLFKMFMRLGTPGSRMTQLPHFSQRFPKWAAQPARANLARELAPEYACTELLLKCVQYEPGARITATIALTDEWLSRQNEVADSPSPIGLF